VAGSSFRVYPGGKGANQAVAASRAGGEVAMVGRIGDDIFSSVLTDSLLESGVRGDYISVAHDTPTGSAFIVVDEDGENSIVVVSGANGTLGVADVDSMSPVLEDARVFMLQLEIPIPVVERAADVARRAGVVVMLDPAPPAALSQELIRSVDIVTPNEHEAEFLTGRKITDLNAACLAASDLVSMGFGRAVVKLGERGLVYAGDDRLEHIPGHRLVPKDTTAAGDTFAGALAVAICEGKSLGEACRFANAAAAISITRAGAQTGMPWREEIDGFLRETKGGTASSSQHAGDEDRK